MDESHALSMMIGLLAPTVTSDTFLSVLMGIPGTAGSQATVVDGFPLAKRGEGARALGGCFFCLFIRWNFRRHCLNRRGLCGSANHFGDGVWRTASLIVLALSMIGMLTGTSALKGLTTCGVGLLIGSIGAAS